MTTLCDLSLDTPLAHHQTHLDLRKVEWMESLVRPIWTSIRRIILQWNRKKLFAIV